MTKKRLTDLFVSYSVVLSVLKLVHQHPKNIIFWCVGRVFFRTNACVRPDGRQDLPSGKEGEEGPGGTRRMRNRGLLARVPSIPGPLRKVQTIAPPAGCATFNLAVVDRQDNDRRRQTSNDQACILNPTCGRHTTAHGPKGIHEGTHERGPRAMIHQERPGPGGHGSIRTKRNEKGLCPFGSKPSKFNDRSKDFRKRRGSLALGGNPRPQRHL